MQKVRNFTLLWATLVFFWLLLNGSFAPDVLLIGMIAAFLIVRLFRSGMSPLSDFNTTPHAFRAAVFYLFYFLKELIKSNLRLAAIVLSPSLPVKPGIVKVRTSLKSPMGRLLLANSITLTPGTLTVELREEWLYIHWVTVDSSDTEAATASIVAGFERYLEVMYG
ncbi:MAG: Na+/H+ antiporter subunit E [Candidatus Thiodiazotropha sp.]|jgi:multicomponent Na+:H+ antiporter subunit E